MLKNLFDQYVSLIKSHLPHKKEATPSIGLDIGTDACKAIEIVPQEDSFEIVNWAVESVESDGLVPAVKRIFDKFNIESKSIYPAISGQGTLIRYIDDLPRMVIEDLRKSITLEGDKHFPFPKETIYTDCYILDSNNKQGKMSVLVAAAKKGIVEQRLQLLNEMNVHVDFIGINPIAIANVFNMLKTKA